MISKGECELCQKYLVEKIEGVEKRANLLLGTTTISIVLLIIETIKTLGGW